MKKQGCKAYPGVKVYFTEADPSAQQSYGIHGRDLDAMLKMSLLLSDHVILSAGHMLRSVPTFSWLQRNHAPVAALASQGALLVSISGRYSSFREFAEEQVREDLTFGQDRDAEFPIVAERARFLDDLFAFGITWQTADESNWFKDMLLSHLRAKDSPLRKRLIGLSTHSLVTLVGQIEQTSQFGRGPLRTLASEHCPRHRKLIMRYGDCYYYLSGARSKEAFPLMHAHAALLLQEQVAYAARSSGLCPTEAEVWRTFMDEWGVSPPLLARLSMADVLHVRCDLIGKKVRNTYARLLNAAKEGTTTTDAVVAFRESQGRLFKLLTYELVAQRAKHERWNVGQGWIANTSWVTGGISTLAALAKILTPVAGGIAGLVRLAVGAPLRGTLEKRFGGTELVLLANEIRRRSR